jgi:hypothetical protein
MKAAAAATSARASIHLARRMLARRAIRTMPAAWQNQRLLLWEQPQLLLRPSPLSGAAGATAGTRRASKRSLSSARPVPADDEAGGSEEPHEWNRRPRSVSVAARANGTEQQQLRVRQQPPSLPSLQALAEYHRRGNVPRPASAVLEHSPVAGDGVAPPALEEEEEEEEEEEDATSTPTQTTEATKVLRYSEGPPMPIVTRLHIVTPEEDVPRGIWPVFRLMVRCFVRSNVLLRFHGAWPFLAVTSRSRPNCLFI